MEKMEDHLRLIFKISNNTQEHFIIKEQDALVRFVYGVLQKVQKISKTFLMLYHQLDDNDELEFSFGILTRSLLMDMILMLKLKNLINSYEMVSEELKAVVKKFCYSVVVDGAKYELQNIYYDDNITEADKRKFYEVIDKIFPNAFDFSGEKPKLNPATVMPIVLSKFCEECKDQNINEKDRIRFLYSYYSKYDHLSHLSSFLTSELPFEKRKKMFDSTVVLILMHLQDLLATAYDFDDDYKILYPYIEELKLYLKTHYE
jgi:hypothetical protein